MLGHIPPMSGPFLYYARAFLGFARWRVALALALVIAGAALEGIGIVFVIPFLALFAGALPGGIAGKILERFEAMGLTGRTEQLLAILSIFVVLLVLRNIIGLARDMLLPRLALRFVDHWRERVFHGLASARWPVVAGLARHEIEHAITSDVARLSIGSDQIVRGFAALGIMATQIAIAFWLSVPLTLLVLAGIAATALLLAPLIGKARRWGERQTEAGRGLYEILGSFLSGLKLAKAHGAEAGFAARFDAITDTLRRQMLDFQASQAGSRAIYQTASGVLACVVIAAGLLWLKVPLPVLTAVLLIMVRLTSPAFQLIQAAQGFANMLPAFAALTGMAARFEAAREENGAGASPFAPAEGAPLLEFRDVGFAHAQGERRVLDGVSLAIRAGEALALTGPSGTGKTSLVDLATGLLRPDSGAILVGGAPLDTVSAAGWRDVIAYVPQDPFLFDRPLRDNLAWFSPGASEADMRAALALVEADAVVDGLPRGLDTRPGERGQRLSGGERQRLCLARALLRRPGLLILDEATSALDEAMEARIMQRIRDERPDMAILLVTHRRAALAHADRVLRLEHGSLATA